MFVRPPIALGVLTLGFVALFGLTPPGRAQGKEDPALEGTWEVISWSAGGRDFTKAQKGIVFTIKGGKLDQMGGRSGTYRADTSPSPKHIDWEFIDPETRKSYVDLGIYKFEKDVLTLCFGGKRPLKFETTFRGGEVLIVLRRGEPKVAEKKPGRPVSKEEEASIDNLKKLVRAMHDHHDVYKRLPPHAMYSKDGKPLLSWRVKLLPFIGEGELSKQFKLNEPWDSAHNKKLLEKMPKIYAPARGTTKGPHSTYYQVFTGPRTPFIGIQGMTLSALSNQDGTANTALVVEAGEAVPWTKPDDLQYNPKQPLPKLGGMFEDVFYVALADGSVRPIRRKFDPALFRPLITWDDNQPIAFDKLTP